MPVASRALQERASERVLFIDSHCQINLHCCPLLVRCHPLRLRYEPWVWENPGNTKDSRLRKIILFSVNSFMKITDFTEIIRLLIISYGVQSTIRLSSIIFQLCTKFKIILGGNWPRMTYYKYKSV